MKEYSRNDRLCAFALIGLLAGCASGSVGTEIRPASRSVGLPYVFGEFNIPTDLEMRALNAVFAGHEPWAEEFRRQISRVGVLQRTFTGVGIYTDFDCPGMDPITSVPAGTVPSANASHPDVLNGQTGGIRFLVFLKDGCISTLEGVTVVGSWPESPHLISFP